MPPRAQPIKNVYIVFTSSGIDSVYSSVESAQARQTALRSKNQDNSVRVEVHLIITDGSDTAVAAGAKATGQNVKTPAKAKTTTAAGTKKDDAAPAAEKKQDESSAGETAVAATAGDVKAPEAKEDAATTKAATKPKSKTTPADEQRALNAKKGTKNENDDLPDNFKVLLNTTSKVLAGETIVVTGVPPILGRKNAEKLVEAHGGRLGTNIAKSTSFVFVGDEAGPSKLDKIKEKEIEILYEEGFVKRLEDRGAGKKTTAKDDAAAPKTADAPAKSTEDEKKKPKKSKKRAAEDDASEAKADATAAGDDAGGEKKKVKKSKKAKE